MTRTLTVTVSTGQHPEDIVHDDVARVTLWYGALRVLHTDLSETVYAARSWDRYTISPPEQPEPVAAVRDPDHPDMLLEILADHTVRRPSPASMPMARRAGL